MSLKRDILIGLGLLAIGLLIVTTLVGIAILFKKAMGLLLILFGIFLLAWFPDVMGQQEYQQPQITTKGVWIGIIALLVGIYLLVF